MLDPMSPPDVEFHSVSPKLAQVRIITTILTFLPLLAGGVALAVLVSKWWWIGFAVVVIMMVWSLAIIHRQVRAMAFGTGDDDFLIRKGIMFRRLTLIPYGRIQYGTL